MTIKTTPCRFCGCPDEAELIHFRRRGFTWYAVRCGFCEAHGPVAREKGGAVYDWENYSPRNWTRRMSLAAIRRRGKMIDKMKVKQ